MLNLGKYSIKDRNNIVLTFAGLFGVGRVKAEKISSFLNIHPLAKIKDLLQHFDSLNIVKEYGNLLRIEYFLRLRIFRLIKRKEIINSYQAVRKAMGLPSRGQRTHTNAKTVRILRAMNKHMPIKQVIPKINNNINQLVNLRNNKLLSNKKVFKNVKKNKQKGK